ncbi:NADPH:quinone oxidoreductase family protein [Castellaniella sp.]|uniref:NADPH:quinone oxidoreductase family protein n=1 Tax=Castellaniella sp. TaxID=1955812 RepID=UPI00356937C8
MQALVCHQYGPPSTLVLQERPTPELQPDQVLVDVLAAGINYPDTLIIENRYQFKPTLPFSPGGEFAGRIRAVGAQVGGFEPGQAVLGFCGWGAFAEQIAVPAQDLFKVPEGLPFDVAGSLLLTYGTAYHALVDRAQLQPGETVLILGASGGLGSALTELAKALGARVIAAASSPEKLQACRANGADEVIDYQQEDLRARLKELTSGRGVDVVCDPVGGPLSEAALRSTAWRGRFLVIGFASGEIPRIALNLTLLKGCAVVGVFWGDYVKRERAAAQADVDVLAEWVRAGRIRPAITRRLTLAEIPAALEAMQRRQVVGKWVVLPAGPAAS